MNSIPDDLLHKSLLFLLQDGLLFLLALLLRQRLEFLLLLKLLDCEFLQFLLFLLLQPNYLSLRLLLVKLWKLLLLLLLGSSICH